MLSLPFFCLFFIIYAVFSTVVSQHEGFGFDPPAILGGVSVFSLCLCRFALAFFPQSKDMHFRWIVSSRLCVGVNAYMKAIIGIIAIIKGECMGGWMDVSNVNY